MFYRSEVAVNTKDIILGDAGIFRGSNLEREIKHLVKLILENNQEASPPLQSESFVIAFQGGWGAGKTWATWAFVNHLGQQEGFNEKDKLHTFAFDLLPFGNINESIVNILGEIGERLWSQGVVDVRKEFRKMAVDATPTDEMNAGISLLGLSLSRRFRLNTHHRDNKHQLRNKFKDLSRQGHRFIILLDDLDRMKPDEVIIVIRMIENFKDIPGIIFVLPFYRDAVANAVQQELKLNETSSHVFLRKFIKASITIQLGIDNLQDSFKHEFSNGKGGSANTAIHDHFGMNSSELAWYVLLHVIVVHETIAAINNDAPDGQGNAVAKHYNNNEASNYMFWLPQLLGKSAKPEKYPEVSIFPYRTDERTQPFSQVYGALTDSTTSAETTISQLADLLNEEMLTNFISIDAELIKNLKFNKQAIDSFNEEGDLGQKDNDIHLTEEEANFDKGDKKTVFEELLLPLIKNTHHEPKLTQNFSRRDMEQLSKPSVMTQTFILSQIPEHF